MSLRGYTQSRILARLAAQDREEQLQRRQAQQDAANRIAGLSAIDRLAGAAVQVPGILQQQQEQEQQAMLKDALAGLSAGELAGVVAAAPGVIATGAPEAATPTAPASAPATAPAVDEMQQQMAGVPAALARLAPSAPASMEGETGVDSLPMSMTPTGEYATGTVTQRAMRGGVTGSPAPVATAEQMARLSPTPAPEPRDLQPREIKIDPEAQRRERIAGIKAEQKAVLDTVAPDAVGPQAMDATMVPVGIGGRIPVPPVLPQAVPSDEAPVAPAGTVDPSVEAAQKELQSVEKLTEDPFAVAQSAYLEKIRGYKPPEYKQTPEELAKGIVDDAVRSRKPNPILNILSFGQSQDKAEQSRRLAEKLVAGEIRKLRKAEAVEDRKQFEGMAALEAEQLGLTQKNEADKRRSEIARSKTFSREKMVDKLSGYKQTDDLIADVQDSARRIVDAGEKLPGGATTFLQQAKAMAEASTPEQARTAAAGLNASLVGMGANGAVSLGAKATDKEGLQAAIDAIETAQMSDAQKDFLKKQLIMIQALGKQKEGGRMTDADLRFYLKSLVITDATKPEALLRSIHDLRAQNARSQRQYLGLFGRLYNVDFTAEMLAEPVFDEQLAARANALGFRPLSATGQEMLDRVRGGSLADVARQGGKAAVGLAKSAEAALGGTSDFDQDF